MCGIAGILHLRPELPPPPRESLARMAGALSHRGPDEFGVFRDGRCGLAHSRLSIVDLVTGQQPMTDADGRRWIAFNGEIYNHVELRAELEQRGCRFRTRSDTEVILQAYAVWGEAAFARLNGQWAIALWDPREQTLVLCRDRVGICPLHYAPTADRVLFASEVKALFAGAPELPRAFDPLGIDATFTFWTVVPPQSVYQGVRELEPGHLRVWQAGRPVRDVAYWQPRYPERGVGAFAGTLADATAALRSAMQQATRLRMLRADVPVGSYLSGGLDSSVVAALARAVQPARFRTFSLRFADAEYDETPYQRAMVEHLGTEHAEVLVTRAQIADAFPAVVHAAERPMLRTAPAPLFLLSRLVRDSGIKVVLTGEGADEMLGGYDLFREAKVRRFWARQPGSTVRPRLLDRLYTWLHRSPMAQQAMARQFFGRGLDRAGRPGFGHEPRWRAAVALKRLFAPQLRQQLAGHDAMAALLADLPEPFGRWSPLAQDQYLEVRTLLSGYLLSSQGDRMLMGHGVEGRFPFLDPDVVALADSLPAGFKLRGLDEKHVLKAMARELVPPTILARKKQPYRAPDALSFVAKDRPEWVDERLGEPAVRAAGLFDPAAVTQLWHKCRTREDESQFANADNMAIVGILSAQLLHQSMLAAPPSRVEPPLRTLHERLPTHGSA